LHTALGADARRARVLELLEQVRLPQPAVLARRYPHELSGGQQQRVAIARCLAMSPKIMLFDEITSALDPERVGEVLKVLEDMARDGMTMLVVTHEMNFARRVADRVVFMHQGKVWEQGPAEQIFAEPRTDALRQFLSSVLH
jgi:polar amino acid transport system ATP-binding protein